MRWLRLLPLLLLGCDAEASSGQLGDASAPSGDASAAHEGGATPGDASDTTDAGDGCVGGPDAYESSSVCEIYTVRLTRESTDSCRFASDEELHEALASYLFVRLDGEWVRFADGWRIVNEGAGLELVGDACDTLRGGGAHEVTLTVLCVCVERIDAPFADADAG